MSREQIKVKGILSYPSVFEKEVFNGQEGKYGLKLLIPKEEKDAIKKIQKAVDKVLSDNGIKLKDIEEKYRCLRDGDFDPNGEGRGKAPNHMILRATSINRPVVTNKKTGELIAKEDGLIYGGAIAGVLGSIWYTESYSRQINCNLDGLVLLGKGTPFGTAPKTPDQVNEEMAEFELEDNDEDDFI